VVVGFWGLRLPLSDHDTVQPPANTVPPDPSLGCVCVWHCTTPRSYSNGYLDHHIDEMLALCQAHAIGKVTFAVHGVFAQQDTDRMNRLLAHPGSTVTFWGVADDPVHRWLDSLDPKRTYRDTMPPGWLEWVGLRLFRNLGYVR
jgi:hypothetical protein